MVLARLVAVRRVKNTPFLSLIVRTRKGKRLVSVRDFVPYFYIPDEKGEYRAVDGRRVTKIVVTKPEDVRRLRERYETHYEADIPYTRRFLIDTGIRSHFVMPDREEVHWRDLKPVQVREPIPLRKMYIDVELVGGRRIGEGEVVSVTCFMSGTYLTLIRGGARWREKNWSVFSFKSEEELLLSFLRLYSIVNPDYLLGWNVFFDIDVIKRRVKEVLGIEWEMTSDLFDLLKAYRVVCRHADNRLKEVALREGLTNNVVYTGRDVERLYGYGRIRELARYNMEDVYYCVKIDEKYHLFDLFVELKELVGLSKVDDAFRNSVLIDTLLLIEAKRKGIILPSQREHGKKGYKGAIVFQPPAGVYEGVAVLDMSRYYPSIILTFNISPDGAGLLPQIVKSFLAERKKLESELEKLTPGSVEYEVTKMRRNAVKYLVNAVYGFLAYSGSRIFKEEAAAFVTEKAREGLVATKRMAENLGYRVLYGDTDSIMIQIPFEDVEKVLLRLNEGVERYFRKKYGVVPKLALKFERYFSRVLFTGVKKRYAGIVIWEGKSCNYLHVKGFEAVRSDQSPYAQKLQEDLLRFVLAKNRTREEIVGFLKSRIENFKKADLNEVAIRKAITKDFDSYVVKPAHVRGAILANLYLGCDFRPGDVVKMLYVKKVEGLPRTDVICFDNAKNLPPLEVDWNRMVDAALRNKIDAILRVFGLNFDSIFTNSLEGWL